MKFAKMSRDALVVEKAERNFFLAALGLVALMLVSDFCFGSSSDVKLIKPLIQTESRRVEGPVIAAR